MRLSYFAALSVLSTLVFALPNPNPRTDEAAAASHKLARRQGTANQAIRDVAVGSASQPRQLVGRDALPGAFAGAGSSPGRITALQYLLAANGHPTAADGEWGPNTQAATQAFQTAVGLEADGIPGPDTLGKLVQNVQAGSTGDVVRAAQALLNEKGASIDVDGDFGPATKAATQSFQTQNGLDADGIIGPKTWAALFGGGGGGGSGGGGGGGGGEDPPPDGSGTDSYCRGINDAGIQLIKEFEGFVPGVYDDPTEHPTVGYGHLCKETGCAEIPYSIPLTEETGTALLNDDLPNYTECMGQYFKVPLNDNQWAAIASFTYNLGCGELEESSLLSRINNGEDPNTVAAEEMPQYRFSEGVSLEGLERRRAAEVELFQTPSSKQATPKCDA